MIVLEVTFVVLAFFAIASAVVVIFGGIMDIGERTHKVMVYVMFWVWGLMYFMYAILDAAGTF